MLEGLAEILETDHLSPLEISRDFVGCGSPVGENSFDIDIGMIRVGCTFRVEHAIKPIQDGGCDWIRGVGQNPYGSFKIFLPSECVAKLGEVLALIFDSGAFFNIRDEGDEYFLREAQAATACSRLFAGFPGAKLLVSDPAILVQGRDDGELPTFAISRTRYWAMLACVGLYLLLDRKIDGRYMSPESLPRISRLGWPV